MTTNNEIRTATGWVQATPSTPIHAFSVVRGFRITACNGRTLHKARPRGVFEVDAIAPGEEGVCKTCRDGIATGRIVLAAS